MHRLRNVAAIGAVAGAHAGAAYGIVECVALTVLPSVAHLLDPQHSVPRVSVVVTASLLLLYPIVGGVFGALAGLLVAVVGGFPTRSANELAPQVRSSAMSVAILVFVLNLLAHRQLSTTVAALVLCSAAIIAGSFVAASRAERSAVSARLFNPCAAWIILLGWAGLNLGSSTSLPIRAAGSAALLLCVAFISVRAARRAPTGNEALRGARIVVVALGFLGLGAILNHRPPAKFPALARDSSAVSYPPVVIVSLDTVRADHLSVYGYPRDTSPNLAELAKGATLYSHAYAPGDFTLSTHASVFTGLYPSQHGAHYAVAGSVPDDQVGIALPLEPQFSTLAELLATVGYPTFAVVANSAFLTRAWGMAQGFDYFDARRKTTPWNDTCWEYLLRCSARTIVKQLFAPTAPEIAFRRADEVNNEVFRLLGQPGSSELPLFLFVNYMDAHVPYVPPPPFDTLYPGKDERFSWSRDYERIRRGINRGEQQIEPRERTHLISQYDGAIASLDAGVGELIHLLRQIGLYDRALLVVFSDHGEAFGERNYMAHGNSVYQDQIGAALIIKYPGQRQPRKVDEPVSLVDLAPTILDVVGLESSEPMAGRSVLASPSGESRLIFSESFPSDLKLAGHERFNRVLRAVISGSLKSISSSRGSSELYNVIADPDETTDLRGRDAATAAALASSLASWLQGVRSGKRQIPQLDDATRSRLRALGYIR